MLSYRRCFPCVSLPLRDGHTTRTSRLQVSSQFAYCSSSMSGGTRLRPPTSVDGITRPSTASVVTEAKPGEQSPEIQTAGTFELNFRTAPSFLFPNYAIVQGYPSKAGDHAYGSGCRAPARNITCQGDVRHQGDMHRRATWRSALAQQLRACADDQCRGTNRSPCTRARCRGSQAQAR